jgi:hypothetical protein
LAFNEPTTGNLVALFIIQLRSGNSARALSIAYDLSLRSDLPPADQLQIAEGIYLEDLNLGKILWRQAISESLGDDLASNAVALGYRLSLDQEMSALIKRLMSLGKQKKGGIQAVSIDETVRILIERSESQQEAAERYLAGSIPVHVFSNIFGIPIADFYLSEPLTAPLALRAFHGGRPSDRHISLGDVAIRLNVDLTSLLFAHRFNILENVLDKLVLSELRAQGLFDARSKVPLTSICIRAFRIYCFCDGEYWGFSGLSAEF